MKKCLCFYAACLILGIGLAVTAELPMNFAWADVAVGDGTGFVSETGKYCANKIPCHVSGCVSLMPRSVRTM